MHKKRKRCSRHASTSYLNNPAKGATDRSSLVIGEQIKDRKLNRFIFVALLENIWYIIFGEDDAAMLTADPADGMKRNSYHLSPF